jgi:hypothetical protein
MTDPARELTPGDRRELRALMKKQFAILRNDVKRRESELHAEVERELLERYRAQDERIAQARDELAAAHMDYRRTCERIVDALRVAEPTLQNSVDGAGRLQAHDPQRSQVHRAMMAAIPVRVASALTHLDQQELDLLRELTISALDSDAAQRFLDRIPSVGELVPAARLAELEAGTS